MKDVDTKMKFIEMRAAGKSFRECAKKLKIAKDTCSTWQKELDTQIAARKAERLDELYQAYGMVKEQRISSLGLMLSALDNELDDRIQRGCLGHLEMKDLIKLRLLVADKLKAEYTPAAPTNAADPTESIRASFMAFMLRVQSGEIDAKTMKVQSEAFAALMTADKATTPPLFDFAKFGLGA